MDETAPPRVVLVHDWLTGMRGGEKCLEVVCRRWPHARLLTLLHRPGSVSQPIRALRPRGSFLQQLPAVHHYYRCLLPLLPLAATSLRVPGCDLVVSFSHCVAKAVRPPRGVPHVCYCFTPMRYAWHLRGAYLGPERVSPTLARGMDRLLERLRAWDRRTAERVTRFVAISRTVQRRIDECYGRPSTVIYPPVDTDFFTPAQVPREDFYLVVSALSPYKRLDLAVTACRRLGRRLVVIGSGQDGRRLRALAGPGVQLLGWQPDEVVRHHLRRCRALLFPGEEDFGLVPVEAQACGTPVIAYGRGGATETVIRPGLLFPEQTAECLADAVSTFEARASDLDPAPLRRQALRFSRRRFAEEFFGYLDTVWRVPDALADSRCAA